MDASEEEPVTRIDFSYFMHERIGIVVGNHARKRLEVTRSL